MFQVIGIVVHQTELRRVVDLLPRNGLLWIWATGDGLIERKQRDNIHRFKINVAVDEHQMCKIPTQKFIRKIVAGAGNKRFVEEEKVLDLNAILHTDGIEVEEGFGIRAVTHAPIHGSRNKQFTFAEFFYRDFHLGHNKNSSLRMGLINRPRRWYLKLFARRHDFALPRSSVLKHNPQQAPSRTNHGRPHEGLMQS